MISETQTESFFHACEVPNATSGAGCARLWTAWLLASLLVSCSEASVYEPSIHPEAEQESHNGAGLSKNGEPITASLTIDNCGLSMIYPRAPRRVIAIGQHTAEILLALGLKDRVVGWSFPDNEPFPDLPKIAEHYPSKEVFLSKEPDFVYSGYLGTFSEERLGSRQSLKRIGINSHVPMARCGGVTRAATLDDVYRDIESLGKIFGLQSRAAQLAASMKEQVADVGYRLKTLGRPIRVLIFGGSHASGVPLVMGGYDLSSELVRLAGGRNVFETVQAQGFNSSLEEIIARDPEVIVLRESATDPEAKRGREFFRAHPSLSEISAVTAEFFVVLPYTASMPGIRNSAAVRTLSEGFYPDKFPRAGGRLLTQ